MRNILIVAGLAALAYGGYRWFESSTGGAIDKAAREVGGERLRRGQRMAGRVEEKMGEVKLKKVRDAVRAFAERFGRNPASLQEMVDEGHLDACPAGVKYDAETGEVSAG